MFEENNNLGVYSGYQQGQAGNNSNMGYQQNPQPGQQNQPEKKKKGSFFTKAAASIAFGLFFGLSAGISFYAVKGVAEAVNPAKQEAEAAKDAENELLETVETVSGMVKAEDNGNAPAVPSVTVTDVTQVVNKVMPSVVSITNSFAERSFYGQFYENEASGSGIIIGENDNELLVVTNYHVIQDADTLKVQFIDGEQVEAQVKGTNANMDLAVIAVQRKDIDSSTLSAITIAELGDSKSLQVGEPAIAIGNALGYGQSVTTGVISAIDRNIEMEGITGTFIQTDAAINPGNSGGALLNMEGEVIGINSNKIGGTVIEGMGYAIPISSAQPILEELMTKTTKIKVDEADKGFIGISGVNVTEDVSKSYNMPMGIYVSQVFANSAAQKAGIVKGDIITQFDDTDVTSMEELQKLLGYYAAGTTVEVTVMQGSPSGYTEKTVSLVLGSQNDITQTQ